MKPGAIVPLLALASTLSAAAGAAELELIWTEPSPTGVRIERRSATETRFTQIAVVGPGTMRFVDSSLIAGDRYCYRVQIIAGNPDHFSPEACAVAESTPTLPPVSSPPPPGVEDALAGDPRVRPGRQRADGGWLQVVPLNPGSGS